MITLCFRINSLASVVLDPRNVVFIALLATLFALVATVRFPLKSAILFSRASATRRLIVDPKEEPEGIGQSKTLSPARRVVVETMYHSSKLSLLPCSRAINVAPLVMARSCAATPPSWTALFIKAYGLTSQIHRELRQTAVAWPWLHIYEHPRSNAVLPVEREYQGERVVFMAKIMRPEVHTLAEIDQLLRYFQDTPVEKVSYFRQWLRLGYIPWFLRRFVFWQTLYLSGYKKAKRFGTFAVSSVGSMGAEIDHAWTPLSTYFTFGPISATGDCTVRIIFDHRVMDARTVARCLATLEEVLNTTILAELRNPQQAAA
jgi:hypothetical protein